MLRLLLDEHVSPKIAEQLMLRQPNMVVMAVLHWDDGIHLGDRDHDLLTEACAQQLTLVTYDLHTSAPLLKSWTEQGIRHGGVIFIDMNTYRLNDFGGLVRALDALWIKHHHEDWTGRVMYLAK